MEAKMTLINDRYELIRIIGKGGFGTTWYARDTKLDMPVAVKELSDTDPARKKKFLREARTLARFAREPGIVNVRDYLEYNGKAYMVMEYLDGSNLNTKIAEGGPISFDAAYHLLRPVILVLGKLHSEGFIHRDVSPDNIIMQSDGTIKLLDFGAAWNTTSTENATTTITVKPGYAPYEQYAGKERQGPFTDVYAVCSTLYKCITGVTPPDALKRAFYDEIKTPSLLGARITPAEEAILMQGLAVNSSDRIQNMEELARLLDKAVGESSPEMSGAFKSSMGSAGAAARANGGRAFKSSVGKRSSEADGAHKDSPEKKNSEGNGKLQEQSTQGYAPHNYAAQGQIAQGYAAQSYAAQNYNAQGQPAQGYAAQNYNAQNQLTQGYAAQNYSAQGQSAQGYAAQNYNGQDQLTQGYAAQNYSAQGYGALYEPQKNQKAQASADMNRSVSDTSGNSEKQSAGSAFVHSERPDRGSAPEKIEKSGGKRRSKSTKSGNTGKKQGRMPKKTLIALIALVAAAIGIVFFIFRGGNGSLYTTKSSPEYAWLEQKTVTKAQLRAIEANKKITNLMIVNCELSDDMVEELGRLTHIESITIDKCTGFTTLDPLADASSLNELKISHQRYEEYTEGLNNLDGTKLFTRDLPNIRKLSFLTSIIDGGTDCLKHFPNLETLSLSLWQPYSIACIESMPNLKDLFLYNSYSNKHTDLDLSGEEAEHLYGHPKLERFRAEYSDMRDLGWAAECTELRELYVDNAQLSDLSPLADHRNLQWLSLKDNRIENILPLAGCDKLYNIDLSENPLTDLNGLEKHENLHALKINNTSVSSLVPLAECIKLNELRCKNAQISDLTGLESCPLMILTADENQIADLTPLSANDTMTFLTVSDNLLTSLTGCEQMIRLKELSAARNSLTGIEGIGNSSGLIMLDVRSNQIPDIEPLRNSFSSLKILNISDNQISDIGPLSVCTALEVLNVDNNQITSLSALEGCSNLTAVMAGSNALTELTGLSGKPGLVAVMVDHNDIGSLDTLKGSIQKLHYLDIGCNNITDIGPLSELSEQKIVLLAERNAFSDLSPLPEGQRFNALVLYGNPITDFTKLINLRDVNFLNDKLYISWNENADMSQLGMTAFASEMHIVSPLDRRGAIEAAIKEGYKEKPALSFPLKPIYLSDEEADAELAAWRADLRDELNGEKKEDESDSGESSAENGTSDSGESSAESGTSESAESPS